MTQPSLLPFTSHHPAYPGPQQLITTLLSVLSPILFQPNLLSWTTELRDDLESKVMGLLEFQGPSPCEGLACFDPNTYPYIKKLKTWFHNCFDLNAHPQDAGFFKCAPTLYELLCVRANI